MAESASVSLKAADLAQVVQKLDRFGLALTPAERLVLSDLLQQAMIVASEGSEVQGYSLSALPLPAGDLLTAFGVA